MSSVVGEIDVACGPMFSGKTEYMIREVLKYSYGSKSREAIFVKPMRDTRSGTSTIKSHYGRVVECEVAETMVGFASERINYDKFLCVAPERLPVIGVDEGQFFGDLAEGCEMFAAAGYIVVVSALLGSYDRDPWPAVCKLLARADNVVKFNSICQECSSHNACFSWLKQKDEETADKVVIGGEDKYMAVCRACYYRLTQS
jgi:thymidine kinase